MNTQNQTKISTMAHIAAGWPLALVAAGGRVGGACSGLAYVFHLVL